MNQRKAIVSGPRYTTKFVNGTHQVFDNVYYGVVDAKPSAKSAQDRADQLNARPRPAARWGARK